MSTMTSFPVEGGPRAEVAKQVRMLLARDQRTQTDLAVALQIGQSQLSKRLRGAIPFDLDELVTIADYFDVSVGNLFGETTNRRPDGGPDGGSSVRARRYSKPQPSDPKVLPLRSVA